MKKIIQPILGAIIFSFATTCLAGQSGQQIVESGNKSGATACASCHGKDAAGNNETGYPRLAGLHPAYLAKQLHDFKSGKRKNAIMNGIANGLNDNEIKTVSVYLSGLKTAATKTSKSNETLLKQGEKLATLGNWDNDIPACFRCHGELALGGGPAMPALAGQHKNYIQNQLQAWKKGERSNDPVGLMSAIANRMSDNEINAVADYLANLSPQRGK